MAQVTVTKPKPTLVPASSVKGYRPDKDGFVGAPEKQNQPSGFVLKTGSPGGYSVGMKTKAPGANLNVGAKNTGPHTQLGSGRRRGPTYGKADSRQVLGVGRTIIPHNGISIGNANGGGI
jgi:hypothetical protein